MKLHGFSKIELLDIYYQMSLSRYLDDKLLIKIGNVLNQYHQANIVINNSRKKLQEDISKKLIGVELLLKIMV